MFPTMFIFYVFSELNGEKVTYSITEICVTKKASFCYCANLLRISGWSENL